MSDLTAALNDFKNGQFLIVTEKYKFTTSF